MKAEFNISFHYDRIINIPKHHFAKIIRETRNIFRHLLFCCMKNPPAIFYVLYEKSIKIIANFKNLRFKMLPVDTESCFSVFLFRYFQTVISYNISFIALSSVSTIDLFHLENKLKTSCSLSELKYFTLK